MNVGRLLRQAGTDSDVLVAVIGPVRPEELFLRTASPLLIRLWGHGIHAMTIGRWIFVRPDLMVGDPGRLARVVIHELVHVRQWADLGYMRFVYRYLTDYLRGRVNGLDHRDAYLDIRLEVEARHTQTRVLQAVDTV